MGLISKIRTWITKPRGPVVLARCGACGETYRARGLFDLRHDEDVDGVACGRQGAVVSIDGEPAR